MADVVLFHHVQGLTDGVRAFAEQLRGGEHTVHTPDLFDGQRPATVDDGIALVRSIGEQVLSERADQVAAGLPEGLVYAGRSGRGPTGSRCRSTGWTRTRSSRWRATSTRPASWSRRSGPSWPRCSSTRVTGTCSPTARCRRTTRTRPRWWCSVRGNSSTGWASVQDPW